MRVRAITAVLVAASTALAPLAASAAEVAGTIAAVSGKAFVARDGRLLRAVRSMRLVRGDRVVTQANGSARIALNDGCIVAMGASAAAGIGSCAETKVVDFTNAGVAGRGLSPAGGTGGATVAVAIGAAASVLLDIAAAMQSGGRPNSP